MKPVTLEHCIGYILKTGVGSAGLKRSPRSKFRNRRKSYVWERNSYLNWDRDSSTNYSECVKLSFLLCWTIQKKFTRLTFWNRTFGHNVCIGCWIHVRFSKFHTYWQFEEKKDENSYKPCSKRQIFPQKEQGSSMKVLCSFICMCRAIQT